MRLLLLAILLVPPLQAQLQVTYNDAPLPGTINLGSVAPTEPKIVSFNVRNAGTTSIAVAPSLAGSGFSFNFLTGAPFKLSPNQSQIVAVKFQALGPGGYSAGLAINDWQTLLRVTVVEDLILVDNNKQVISGSVGVLFGTGPIGAPIPHTLSLENPGTHTLPIPALGIGGTGFRMLPPSQPAVLELRGGEAIRIELEAFSETTGPISGVLTLGNRNITLDARFFEPPLPPARLSIEPSTLRSGMQARVSVAFDSDPQSDASGTLSVSSDTNDQGIVFLPTGKLTLPIVVKKGSRIALLNGANFATLQTGTTAGSIVLNCDVKDQSISSFFAVPPSAIQIDAARASRTASTLEVVITGFDNTRTVGGGVYFTFYGRDGFALPEGVYSKGDFATAFKTLFSQSNAGGIFEVKATFPFVGDPAALSAVEVRIANAIASTQTERIKIQ